ncbi:ribosome small subunit-dependent GTPase A [Alicyclobacillus sp. ALC3]|uniref:ribosome small subunit-dependent GTPase A n=1 Tax=Alicyclobacillus sp. ALC3 TaxID=2796143 RepID=UPI002378A654|nr:ribosome small subunit-dependent GTPase A [Alicyclobacillus sp. ALC3]WDL99446.1 ribosome small subunit-dependent GTPase A [Alicyclobacillus sp. ALC3]
MNLVRLGWTEQLAVSFAAYADQGFVPARVATEHRQRYRLYTGDGECDAEITGKMRHLARGRADYPAVGDWVAVQGPQGGTAVIHAVLPRKSKFSRKEAGSVTEEQIIAANVDTVFLVTALNHDFNLRRLERMLILAWESGANPVVVLSKTDLCEDVSAKVSEVESVAFGVRIHAVSAEQDEGLEELAPYLGIGQTVALLGSSGVGKSTLINRLIGADVMAVNTVREGDDHGRHTTTHRELLIAPGGALIMDTPGMREFQLLDHQEGFSSTFDDIESLAHNCQFGDCEHKQEPGCAVRAAIAAGTLPEARLQSFHKMQKEMRYIERKLAKRERDRDKGNKQSRERYRYMEVE